MYALLTKQEVCKNKKQEQGQYASILTEQAWAANYLLYGLENFNTVEALVSGHARDVKKVRVTGAGHLWECNIIHSMRGRRLKGNGNGVLGAREMPFPFPFKGLPSRLYNTMSYSLYGS